MRPPRRTRPAPRRTRPAPTAAVPALAPRAPAVRRGAPLLLVLVAAIALGAAADPARPADVSVPAPATSRPSAADTTADGWRRAVPDFAWSFPRDHWSHPGYQSEWWYLTGHLRTADGRRFGYQFTFFRVGVLQQAPALDSPWAATDLVMGHAALSDLDGGTHRFSDVLYRAVPLLGGFPPPPDMASHAPAPASAAPDLPGLLAWSRAPAGTPGLWTLRFNGAAFDLAMADRAGGFAFELTTTPRKRLVFQGPDGYSAKSAGADPGASQYYSFTRLATSGTLVVDGDTLAVTGDSWMDKEFGSDKLAAHQVGWDWFSLQLADGRDLMLYVLRDEAGAVDHASGTLVDAAGAPRWLARGEFAIESTARWTSEHTGASYPAAWTVRMGGETWRVRPRMAAQENVGGRVDGLFYWEGAVEVLDEAGAPAGQGFVELTGYGEGRRPGI